MKQYTGTAASDGVAIGEAFILEIPDLTFEKRTITDVDAEWERLERAIDVSKGELEKIHAHAKKTMGEEQAEIFSAHLLILQDPELLQPIQDSIQNDHINAESALEKTMDSFIEMFETMDNAYMRERAADIRDVTKRVLAHLLGVSFPNPALIDEEVIVIAHDLTPSDTAQLNKAFVKGFATNIGGRTSHSAIMARTLEIPAVVGTQVVTEKVNDGDMVILDGLDGTLIANPDDDEIKSYTQKQKAFEKQKAEWAKLKDEPTISKDGVQVELVGNIGSPEDVDGVLEHGGEGVGLYRTEFLYMGKSELPTEDEQFEAYQSVLKKVGSDKPVVVRTLDIGGDKQLDYLELPKEMNPFLGFRAIRFCLENDDLFRTQLRALLRASVHGNLKIMFPMVATIQEFKDAKGILLEEKEKLKSENIPVSDSVEVGIMVEIPSTAVIADQFAKEVDFFSIGTNDLIQYTMAADRMNEKVSYLYQPYHPAILNLVNNIIEAAHKEGKWAGMCGEMAGDSTAVPILFSLGLDEFSMSATSILAARSQIRNLSKEKAATYKEALLAQSTSQGVVDIVKEMIAE